MGTITIEVKELGVTRISITPDQLIFDGDNGDQVCGVELSNETILIAAIEAKNRYSELPDSNQK